MDSLGTPVRESKPQLPAIKVPAPGSSDVSRSGQSRGALRGALLWNCGMILSVSVPRNRSETGLRQASQSPDDMLCKQGVRGSSPLCSTPRR